MNSLKHFFVLLLLCFSWPGLAQETEAQLKAKAEKSYLESDFPVATESYLKLLALQPRDPFYNLRYGTCVLFNATDKQIAIKYLEFAVAQMPLDPEAHYFLGKAYQLNYRFSDALRAYEKCTSFIDTRRFPFPVEYDIQACKDGLQLLSSFNELIVYQKTATDKQTFFRQYSLEQVGGDLVVAANYQTKVDKKNNHMPLMYFPPKPKFVFYASYGQIENNGLDLCIRTRKTDGTWSDAVQLPSQINTPRNENFPYYDSRTGYLYFASQGHNAMGGYDLFRCKYDPITNIAGSVENLDFPISSPDDDFLFIPDTLNEYAFFASSRQAQNGKIHIYKVKVKNNPNRYFAIQGTVKGDLAAVRSVELIDPVTRKSLGVFEPDAAGNYTILIPKNGRYELRVHVKNQADAHVSLVDVPLQTTFKPLIQTISANGAEGQVEVVVENRFSDDPAEIQRLYAYVIRQQASLDPNDAYYFSESSEAFKEIKEQLEKLNWTDLSPQELKDQLITLVGKDQEKLHDVQGNQQKIWNEVTQQANEILALQTEVKQLSSKIANNEDAKEKRVLLEQANEKIAVIAKKDEASQRLLQYADSLNAVASETKRMIDAAAAVHQSVSELPSEVTVEQLVEVVKKHETQLMEMHASGAASAITALTEEVLEAKQRLTTIQPQRTELNKAVRKLKEDITAMEANLTVAKPKDKEAIERQISAKRTEWTVINQELTRLDAKATTISSEIEWLEKRLNEAQMIQRLSTPVKSLSSDQAREKLAETKDPNFNTLQNYVVAELAALKKSDPSPTAAGDWLMAENARWEDSLKSVERNPNLTEVARKQQVYQLEQQRADWIQAKLDEATNNPNFSDEQRSALRDEQQKSDQRIDALEAWAEARDLDWQGTNDDPSEVVAETNPVSAQAPRFPVSLAEWTDEVAALSTEARAEKQRELLAIADGELQKLAQTTPNSAVSEQITAWKEWRAAVERSGNEATKDDPTNVSSVRSTLLARVPPKLPNAGELSTRFADAPELERQQAEWTDEADRAIEALEEVLQSNPTDTAAARKKAEWESWKAAVSALTWELESKEVASQPADLVQNQVSPRVQNLDKKKQQLEAKVASGNDWSEEEKLTEKIKATETYARAVDDAITANTRDRAKSSAEGDSSLLLEMQQLTARKELTDAELAELKQLQVHALKSAMTVEQVVAGADKSYAADLQKLDPNDPSGRRERELILAENLRSKIQANERAIAKKELPALVAENELLEEAFAATQERIQRLENAETPIAVSEVTSDDPANSGEEKPQPELSSSAESTSSSRLEALQARLSVASPSERKSIQRAIDAEHRTLNDSAIKVYREQAAGHASSMQDQKRRLGLISAGDPEFVSEQQQLVEAFNQLTAEETRLLQARPGTVSALEWEALVLKQKRWMTAANSLEEKQSLHMLAAQQQLDPLDLQSEAALQRTAIQLTDEKNQLNEEIGLLMTELLITKKKDIPAVEQEIEAKQKRLQAIQEEQETLEQARARRQILPGEPIDNQSINQVITFEQEQEIALSKSYKEFFSLNQRHTFAKNNVHSAKKQLEAMRNQLDSLLHSPLKTEDQPALRAKLAREIAGMELQLVAYVQEAKAVEDEIKAFQQMEADNVKMMMMQNLVLRGIEPIAPLALAASMVALPATGFSLVENPEATAKRMEIPLETAVPSGLVYRVQVGAFAKPIPEERFNEFTPVSGEKLPNGITRYMAGFFTNRASVSQAQKTIRSIGYVDAFSVAYCDGKRISMDEARRLEQAGLCLPKGTDELMIELAENTAKALVDDTSKRFAVKRDALSYNQAPGAAKAQTAESKVGLFFTVQIGVYNKPVSPETLKNLSPLITKRLANGQIRYSAGIYASIEQALPKKQEAIGRGVKDAFVTAYYRGERITLAEAQALLAERGSSVLEPSIPSSAGVPVVGVNKPVASTSTAQQNQVAEEVTSSGKPVDIVTASKQDEDVLAQSERAIYFVSKTPYEKYPLELLRRMNQKGFFYYDETAKRVYSMVYKNEDFVPELYAYRDEIDTVYLEDQKTQFHLHQFKIEGTISADQVAGDFMDWFIRLAIKREITKINGGYAVRFEVPSADLMEWYKVRLERFGFDVKVFPYFVGEGGLKK